MSSIIEQLVLQLPASVLDKVEGCSREELLSLSKAQQVTYLPATYVDLMLYMGRVGVDWVFRANASIGDLSDGVAKRMLVRELGLEKLSYPSDIFVFSEHHGYIFTLFRTRDCESDPPVFMFESEFFYKASDSLSEFILDKRDISVGQTHEEWEETMKQAAYHYDPEQDEFCKTTF